MAPIRFVYFDLGRVMVNFDVHRMCRQMGQVAGIPADRVHKIVFGNGLQHDYETGRISTVEFYERFCQEAAHRPPQDALVQAAVDIFWLNLDTLPVVAQLQAARIPLGVLSNTCHIHWEHCRQRFSLLQRGFRTYTLSYHVRATKPESAIFAAAAQAAGVAPEEIFFVDDLPQHVAGAAEFGFQAVQYVDAPTLARDLRAGGIRFNY